MDRFISIGQFAAMTRLTVRMLRHYDERDVLSPAKIDPDTGYRYYRVDQAARAEVIRILRSFDVPINDIREGLNTDRPDALLALLARRRDQIKRELAEQHRSLDYLESLLSHLSSGGDLPYPEPAVEERAAETGLSTRSRTTLDDVGAYTGAAIGRLYAAAAGQGRLVTGPPFAKYRPQHDTLDEFLVEICLPIEATEAVQPFDMHTIDGGLFAILTHTGPYEALGAAYRTLGAWIATRNLEPVGPPIERYLTSPATGGLTRRIPDGNRLAGAPVPIARVLRGSA